VIVPKVRASSASRLNLSYFDPRRERYETLATGPSRCE